MEFGVVGRITDGFFTYQAWPTVAKDEKGVLYAVSSGHRLGHVCPFGKNLMYKSYDEGKSWEGPTIINDTFLDDRDAGLCIWGDGNMLLSWFNLRTAYFDEYEGKYPSISMPLSVAARETWKTMPPEKLQAGSYIRLSHDYGKTWGEQIRVPVTSPHGPVRKADGSLLYLGKVYLSPDDTYPDKMICATESRDGGKTWQKLGVVELPEGIDISRVHEPHAIELPDGTVLGAIRISGLKGSENTVAITRSTDGGLTWTKPEILGVTGTPPHLLLHSSGAVVMTYSCRKAPHGQRVSISRDGGKTWGEELTISEESPDWDHGYPSSVELSDGSILTVYYQKYPGDTHNSILYTKWALPR